MVRFTTEDEVHSVISFFTTHGDVFRRDGVGMSPAMGSAGVGGLRIEARQAQGKATVEAMRAMVREMDFDAESRRLTMVCGKREPYLLVHLHLPLAETDGVRVELQPDDATLCEAIGRVAAEAATVQTLCVQVARLVCEQRPDAEETAEELLARRRSETLRVLRADPVAFDFLLTSFQVALRSYRRSSVAVPFPDEHATSGPAGDADYDGVAKALDAVPRLGMLAGALGNLPETTTGVLHWLAESARPLRLVARKRIEDKFKSQKAMPSCTQLDVGMQPSPEFRALAEQHGTTLGFHGSALENFHSILRNGLRNMSNTRYMRTGAAFGDGVYLSTDISVAASFTAYSDGCKHSRWHGRVGCIAVCDVVNHPSIEAARRKARDEQDRDSYLVVEDDRYIHLRHILLFHDDSETRQAASSSASADGSSEAVPAAATPAARREAGRRKWYFLAVAGYLLLMAAILFWQRSPGKASRRVRRSDTL